MGESLTGKWYMALMADGYSKDYKVVVSISAKTAAETYAEGGGGVKLVGGLAIEMEQVSVGLSTDEEQGNDGGTQLGTREPHFTRMRRPGE